MKNFGSVIVPVILLFCAACGDTPEENTSMAEESLKHDDNQCRPNHGSFKSDRHEFHIQLSNGAPATVVGQLYYHGSFHNKTLLVTLHGGSYAHTYWDAPVVNGRSYSFACYMARQGYAILALDNLGSGQSSGEGQLDGDFLSTPEVAAGIGKVVTQLRQDHNPVCERFRKIVLVGHSLGSETTLRLQADSHPADALILTGWGHVPPPGGGGLDPALLALLIANPYITIPSEIRAAMFYGPTADPAMIAYDNAHLAVRFPRGQFLSGFGIAYQPALTGAAQVTGKVLVQLGDDDVLFPGNTAPAEQAAYPNAQATIQELPSVGHCMNLHPANQQGWTRMDNWLHQNHF